MIIEKVKRSLRFRQIGNYFREYCTCTGVHGFRYIGEKRTIFERIWWAFAFLASLSTCSYVIYLVYMKWESSPVIVTFATKETPIHNIPFPVVTVCLENKYDKWTFNFTELKLNITEENVTLTNEDLEKLEYMTLLCRHNPAIRYVLRPYVSNTVNPENTLNFFNKIKGTVRMLNCEFMGKPFSCHEYFTRVFTEEGVCFSFNMVNRSEIFKDTVSVVQYEDFLSVKVTSNWSMEHGYSAGATPNSSYPKRAEKSGVTNGLSLFLRTWKNDFDYTCRDGLQGFRVTLHTAVRLPSPSTQFFRVPLDTEVLAGVQPVMITTSDSVKKHNPDKRGCYFVNERTLKYYKKYSKFNCWTECLTNYTYDLCNCVNYFMPREKGMQFCGFKKLQCMQDAKELMEFKDISYQMQESSQEKGPTKLQMECNCLPLCADLSYDIETSQAHFDYSKGYLHYSKEAVQSSKGVFPLPDDKWIEGFFKRTSTSKLTVFFKSSHFISSERNVLYGPTDFLANFGGLLSLFTGFSVLSLMEIIYFMSIRIICNIRLYGLWSGPQN